MTAQHTPGPWEQDPSDEYAIMANCGSVVATVLTGSDFPCLDDSEQMSVIPECIANARLIAAAPELLAALEAVTNVAEWESVNSKMAAAVRYARAAIAKATGAA